LLSRDIQRVLAGIDILPDGTGGRVRGVDHGIRDRAVKRGRLADSQGGKQGLCRWPSRCLQDHGPESLDVPHLGSVTVHLDPLGEGVMTKSRSPVR
jgi:hypothetical protein